MKKREQTTNENRQIKIVTWVDSAGLLCKSIVPIYATEKDYPKGAPYGIPWEEIYHPSVTPEVISKCLHNADIWTEEDLRKNPNKALSALMEAYSLDVSALLIAAHQYSEGGN